MPERAIKETQNWNPTTCNLLIIEVNKLHQLPVVLIITGYAGIINYTVNISVKIWKLNLFNFQQKLTEGLIYYVQQFIGIKSGAHQAIWSSRHQQKAGTHFAVGHQLTLTIIFKRTTKRDVRSINSKGKEMAFLQMSPDTGG